MQLMPVCDSDRRFWKDGLSRGFVGGWKFRTAERMTLVSSEEQIYSKSEISACDISGLIDARVWDLHSEPYLCF